MPVAKSTADTLLALLWWSEPVQKVLDGAPGKARRSIVGLATDASTIDLSSSRLGSRQVLLPANVAPLRATAAAQEVVAAAPVQVVPLQVCPSAQRFQVRLVAGSVTVPSALMV